MKKQLLCSVLIINVAGVAFAADQYNLLTGVDATKYPGAPRFLPGPPIAPVFDGDRLAGTNNVGPTVTYQGNGTPFYQPNQFGSLSFLFRRGNVPIPGGFPYMGIEFLGGPLLDLDGNLANGQRKLTPTENVPPLEIPGTTSFLSFSTDLSAGVITLVDADITGNNEGGPGQSPEIATILVTIAGTQPDGSKLPGPNPTYDTRTGSLSAFAGTSGTLTGVYRIENLGYELWEDAIDPFGSSPEVLGSMQFFGSFRGWLVLRDRVSNDFPTLAGQGLGSSIWPAIAVDAVGRVMNTANGLAGGTATIRVGATGQDYSLPGNGGVALTDFGGDIGAYFDAVVVPQLAPNQDRFIYLESAGYGVNNSTDPVFIDTIGYDATFIAAANVCGAQRGADANCDGAVTFADIDYFVAAISGEAAWQAAGPNPGCGYACVNDLNADGAVNFTDIDLFVAALSAP